MTRLKALWYVLTAKDFLLAVNKKVLAKGDPATKTAYAIIALKNTYDETPEMLKPYVKEVVMTAFMPFGKAVKSLTENIASAVNDLTDSLAESAADLSKQEALKQSLSKPTRKRKK